MLSLPDPHSRTAAHIQTEGEVELAQPYDPTSWQRKRRVRGWGMLLLLVGVISVGTLWKPSPDSRTPLGHVRDYWEGTETIVIQKTNFVGTSPRWVEAQKQAAARHGVTYEEWVNRGQILKRKW